MEQRNFERVLGAFTRQTGVTVRYTSAGYSVPVFLQARLVAHRLPDMAFLPQPGLLRRYAAEHLLVRLNGIAGAAVASNYNATWRRLGSVGTALYGVWFKAADKSLIWYQDVRARGAGAALGQRHAGAAGAPARRAGNARVRGRRGGWLDAGRLVLQPLPPPGRARRYDLMAAHRIAWTDPSVTRAPAAGPGLRPRFIAGGVPGALRTSYAGSSRTFAPRPAAAMVFEGDFVAGVISGQTHSRLGVDADTFAFPAAGGPPRWWWWAATPPC